ncbi:alpha-amylase family protein [Shewanella xiamenensis]|uniref:alpha-amylase family protein n=1 Tax=Shewanella xiamenensis TaxID=332186 RepID=UPI001669335F|nr:alpha-amylase family protein [Shewanella xiamenensis]MCL1072660.1 alpha-amylase family protein [Shewanella xiamenensis]GGN03186.1 O-glycosyl hydrolase family 13 [Shewanella xiamenensis]
MNFILSNSSKRRAYRWQQGFSILALSSISTFCTMTTPAISTQVTALDAVAAKTVPANLNADEGEILPADHNAEQAYKFKPVVYQIFTRLYGNKNTTNKPWGTISENGVGKFNDIDDTALKSIKDLGVTHVWYTGVPHHALIGDYSAIGVSHDDPDVVKGRAGSPYAVKDYYNVNPDLAVDPAKRLQEFQALIERTHKQGLKVIIDIVPNHVARNYHSITKPEGVRDFGEDDNQTLEYAKHNNFYYVTDKKQSSGFQVPDLPESLKPLGGESHPLSDGQFEEIPAKSTGNGSRLAKPDMNDWYETVKINYGVRPDGSHDFPALPLRYATLGAELHYDFWQQRTRELPNSWIKFNQIAQYWLAMGVDGFRYDMAEMVPVEFWSYLNSHIKHSHPEAFILAEVYNPAMYRDYIQLGKMDYLYDKVDLYDTLKAIMAGQKSTAQIAADQAKVQDIDSHMLHFLENHDEQRIANAAFLGALTGNTSTDAVDPRYALPAMVVSATLSTSPTLIYFGQEVGEAATQNLGFGHASRTSIFDYAGVPAHQRWMNQGKFDGGQSTPAEVALRTYYQKLLNLSTGQNAPALLGQYDSLDAANRSAVSAAKPSNKANNKTINGSATSYDDATFAFVRFEANTTANKGQKLIIVSNFSQTQAKSFSLKLPQSLIAQWQLTDATYPLKDLLEDHEAQLVVEQGEGQVKLQLAPLSSAIFELVH